MTKSSFAHLICRALEVGVAFGTLLAFDRLGGYFA